MKGNFGGSSLKKFPSRPKQNRNNFFFSFFLKNKVGGIFKGYPHKIATP
jgi:hypothetical protein